ncbi:MAG: LCP family protein [Vulcanimicrobiota bacterium]
MNEKPLFMKKKPKTGLIVLVLLLIIAGFFVYKYFIKHEEGDEGFKIGPILSSPAGEVAFKNKDNLVILVLGLDESRDEKGILHHKGSRTDTIFLLNVNKKADRLGILSIPRDTWVFLDDKYGNGRINSVYVNAFWDTYADSDYDYELAKEKGIEAARQVVSDFLGIEVDYFVLLKIKAAQEFVDAIGGVPVNVEKDMDYDDNWGNLHIHLKKGPQRLNGEQAVGYARFRHDEEGDWGRIRRQQQFVKALVNELKKPNHIMHIDKIAKVIKENIETDLNINQLVDLARAYKDFNKNKIVKGIIRGEDEVISGSMVIIPNQTIKDRLVARILKDPAAIPPQETWVRVLNGCDVNGLGGLVSDKLKEQGYNVVEVTNADVDTMERTEIIDHFINPEITRKLEKEIGTEKARSFYKESENSDLTLDYTIVLGKDSCPKPEEKDGENSEKPEQANGTRVNSY